MMTLGIDIGKHKHNATLLDDQGKKVFHNMSIENNADGVSKLINAINSANISTKGILVGMEATGHYWMNLFAELETHDFLDIHIINPMIIHARRNETVRGAKTDRIDSFRIAKYLREADHRSSSIPSDEIAELRKLARLRYDLVQNANSMKLQIISYLDIVFPEYVNQFRNIFGIASRKLLEDYPTAEMIAKVDIRRLTSVLKNASRGRLGRGKAEQLKEVARQSFASKSSSEAMQISIRFTVQQLNMLLDQIKQLEKMTASMLVEQQNILKSIPGIGVVYAPAILAEILPVFQPELRTGADKLVAHAGLDAKPNLSGKNNSLQGKSFKMSKRGSKYLRTAVMEAAINAAITQNDPMFRAIYDRQKEKGKKHLVAASHVARKMLHVIFALLRDNKTYIPLVYESKPTATCYK